MKHWRYFLSCLIGGAFLFFWIPFSILYLPKIFSQPWIFFPIMFVIGIIGFGGPMLLGIWWQDKYDFKQIKSLY